MMKILLLDDHPLIIDFIAEQIRKIDSDVLVMTSIAVEQALDILSTHKIDRVVCDLQIKSGKSVAVPEYCAKHNIPFMVFSSYVNNSLIHTLKSLNVNCYVSKGTETQHLITALKKLINAEYFLCPEVVKEQHILSESDTPRPILSKAEIKVLNAYKAGLKTEEVAKLLNIQTVTVRNHRARAQERNLCGFQELIRRFNYWDDSHTF